MAKKVIIRIYCLLFLLLPIITKINCTDCLLYITKIDRDNYYELLIGIGYQVYGLYALYLEKFASKYIPSNSKS